MPKSCLYPNARHTLLPLIVAILLGCLVQSSLQADIRLPGLFSDKMVLQRGESVRVWGTAEPGEQLEIRLGDESKAFQADENGKWLVEIAPPPAGGPYEMVIAGAEAQVVMREVMVGDVWLCSGQSNMEWSVRRSSTLTDEAEIEKYLSSLVDPRIRLFSVPRHAVEEPAQTLGAATTWQEASPSEIAEFSAVAWYFAKALRESGAVDDVPIGLIDSSWGGTPGEAWTSRAALDAKPSLEPLLAHWDDNPAANTPHRPASLYNGMIHPLLPYTLRGAVWYQGESNVGRAAQYATIMPTLIEDWRSRFQNANLPFLMVQLAPFRYGNRDPRALAELWDAQNRTLALDRVGMSGSSDIGDLQDIHPRNKEEVGRRLALIARHMVYGESDLEFSGPRFATRERIEGTSKLKVTFSHAEGLHVHGESLTGFEVSGADGQFHPATAHVDEGAVLVESEAVSDPLEVRYLWTDTAAGNLFNEAGLPAFPFRSDSFDLLSAGVDF